MKLISRRERRELLAKWGLLHDENGKLTEYARWQLTLEGRKWFTQQGEIRARGSMDCYVPEFDG
jgi:hypothetical protein